MENANLEFDNDNGTGLQVYMCAHLDTDYTSSSATDNAWVAYSLANTSDDYPQNWCNTASATWEITAVQLEVGSTATPFEHKSYGQELAACKRYCEKLHGDTQYEMVSMQFAYNTTSTEGILYYLPKRANPTITQYSTGASGWKIQYSTSASVLSAVPTFDLITLTNSRITASISSGLTALQSCYLRTEEDTSYIIVDAEL
jgi:hypothetical protein